MSSIIDVFKMSVEEEYEEIRRQIIMTKKRRLARDEMEYIQNKNEEDLTLLEKRKLPFLASKLPPKKQRAREANKMLEHFKNEIKEREKNSKALGEVEHQKSKPAVFDGDDIKLKDLESEDEDEWDPNWMNKPLEFVKRPQDFHLFGGDDYISIDTRKEKKRDKKSSTPTHKTHERERDNKHNRHRETRNRSRNSWR